MAILGSGNIGTDLLIKVRRSDLLTCAYFIGRDMRSAGLAKAESLGVRISNRSIEAIVHDPDCCDLVFDATSALAHSKHWPILRALGKTVIDLTPSRIGKMCVPAVNLEECADEQNVNMVTCGGQAAIPLVHLFGQLYSTVEYIEVVSSIASRSAGAATRINIDEYVETTERAIRAFSPCQRAKAILILNPGVPCVDMQTTISAKVRDPNVAELKSAVDAMVAKIRLYVPGCRLVVGPVVESDRVVIMVKVQGLGDYLPRYAGNLDIINCAAIATAEQFARRRWADHERTPGGGHA